jgi:alpha-glucosidase
VEDSGGGHLILEARAFNDGVAFRYVFPAQASLPIARITCERTQSQFTQDATLHTLVLENFNTPYEVEYIRCQISNLHPEWLIGLPLLAELLGKAWVAITEADIDNYPGMYLRHEGDFTSLLRA